jgi:hypothetical protein
MLQSALIPLPFEPASAVRQFNVFYAGWMSHMNDLGKALIGIGLLLAVIGAVLILAARFGLPLGRLPGDMSWRGKNVSIFFPIGTSILLSAVLSAILFLVSRFRR